MVFQRENPRQLEETHLILAACLGLFFFHKPQVSVFEHISCQLIRLLPLVGTVNWETWKWRECIDCGQRGDFWIYSIYLQLNVFLCVDSDSIGISGGDEARSRRQEEPDFHLCCHGNRHGGQSFSGSFWQLGRELWLLVWCFCFVS